MAALSLLPNPLKWTGSYYNRETLWPAEPDITVIRSLAVKHLASELPNIADLDKIEVQFFAQGGSNKLYSISFPGHGTSYLFRVALPLVPYYRIESEAATLSYLQKNTSIPVSRVIAWESSVATDLGFEWILLEKIEGVALYEVWRGMRWDSKVKLVAALAPLLGQLRDHKFDEIGSLYFSGREEPIDPQYWSETALPTDEVLVDSAQNAPRSHDEDSHQHEDQSSELTVAVPPDMVALQHDLPSADSMRALFITSRTSGYLWRPEGLAEGTPDLSTEASGQNRYTVGLLHDPLFYLYRRLYLPGNRGPFRSSRDWMDAELDFQRRWIRTAHTIKTSPVRDDFDVNDWSSDCDEEAPELEKLTLDFQGVLPEVFPDSEEEVFPYILYHHDLSLASILVNPDTFEITGILDWEKIQVVPEWKASRFPKFLNDQIDFEGIEDGEPRMPTPAECEEDGEDYNPVVVERRDRWDNKILRQHYDEALSRIRVEDHFFGYMKDSAKTKRDFEKQVWDITEGARSARTWLEERSKNHQ